MRASSRWRYHTAQPAEQTEPDMAIYDTVVLSAVLAEVVGIGLGQPGPDPHPHMLVQRPVVENGHLVGFRKCVDLAAGRTVPLHAHHEHIPTGTAGAALSEKAGHWVIPGAPLTP